MMVIDYIDILWIDILWIDILWIDIVYQGGTMNLSNWIDHRELLSMLGRPLSIVCVPLSSSLLLLMLCITIKLLLYCLH